MAASEDRERGAAVAATDQSDASDRGEQLREALRRRPDILYAAIEDFGDTLPEGSAQQRWVRKAAARFNAALARAAAEG